MLKRLTKIGFICCLGAALIVLAFGVCSVWASPAVSGKLVTSGGILLALAGVLQLEVSNFFSTNFCRILRYRPVSRMGSITRCTTRYR